MPQDNLDDLRHIEGFPLGDDADLHALSDPPHYTAYPNPHMAEFIAQHGTPYDETTDDYHREPYVADVIQSRNEPIYYAHTYHTKVPYQAIAKFIEHYTSPGDVVLDGFCGSGMTGIAAQVTGRKAILSDLSPSATFLARNYNFPLSSKDFNQLSKRISEKLFTDVGWLYSTHLNDGTKANINFVIWSAVFSCPYCETEFVFWHQAIDTESKTLNDPFCCPSCSANLTKSECKDVLDENGQMQFEPVAIFAKVKGIRSNIEKEPSDRDYALLQKLSEDYIPYWYPTDRMPEGDEARRNDKYGLTNVNHFYTKRNLWSLASLYKLCRDTGELFSLFLFTSLLEKSSRRTMTIISNYLNEGRGGFAGKPMTGTLYVPSVQTEASIVEQLKSRISSTKRFTKKFAETRKAEGDVIITTQSTTDLQQIPNNSVDYIFVDPPFGSNLMYSELNYVTESWLRVKTNNRNEAIVNRTQGKNLDEYRNLMTNAFQEMCRVLKPNRWITVEFHNSKAAVWNAIQEGLSKAGFIVAQVVTLDKGRASFIQYASTGSVKNDLVINAYKPRAGFTQKFSAQAGRGLEADFVRQHLQQLPLAANVERSKEMLYSKYLAYYVQHGYQVQYNGEQFYRALSQWGLVESDGYWFSDEQQVGAYGKRKAENVMAETPQAPLFIFDERSAIQWLKHTLHGTPATLSDIQPAYLKALQTSRDQMPDLRELLDENFGQPDSSGRYHWPHPQLQETLEEARQQRLLRHFNDYLKQATAGQRLKEVRKEALVAGFTEAYRAGRFRDILTVGHKLHKKLLEENLELFDFVEIAEAKLEG